jgi:acyl-CoA synthetase (AMP-forming)/AMP-acid ligase II
MRVEDFLRDSARRLPAKTALVAGKRRLTFADLDVMSDRLAAALARRGIARGDRVAVFMENSFEAVVAIVAVLKAGAVFSPVNPSTKSDKLSFILNNSRAAGIITQARFAGTAGVAVARSESVKLVVLAGGGTAPVAVGCLSFEEAITHTGNPPAEGATSISP